MPATPKQRDYAESRSLAGQLPIYAVDVSHPDIADNARAVADTIDHTIEGHRYPSLAFSVVEPQNVGGEIRQAEIRIDNVGRTLTQWVELSKGGRNAKVRVMRVQPVEGADSEIVWSITMGAAVSEVNNEFVAFTLSNSLLFNRPGVKVRHDPQTSPGLF